MRLWTVLVAGAVSIAALSQAMATEPAFGRWAADPAHCGIFGGGTPQTAALTVTETSLAWFSGYCRIGKMYKAGPALYLQAHCWGEWPSEMPVTLDARGDRLKVSWNRARPEELRRCR